jgi:hypothetical protein
VFVWRTPPSTTSPVRREEHARAVVLENQGAEIKTMKTIHIESKEHHRTQSTSSSVRLSRRLKTAIISGIAALALASGANADSPSKCDACVGTARLVYYSDLNNALSDYSRALANANNQPTEDNQKEARRQAVAGYRDAVKNARAQFSVRRDLCQDLGEDRYNPVIKPSDFLSVSEIVAKPNPLYPLIPGTTMNYRSETDEGTETVAVTVTRETRNILGVTCLVVRDTVKLNGAITEDTIDWFAQDRSGNVWYFGESTAEYEDGLIANIDGSWRADLGDAHPGIVMFAHPAVGKVYRQELLYTEAEDAAEVIALDESVTVPAGSYPHCLKTEEFTPLEPEVSEFKFYAPGIGNVLTVNPDTGKRSELVSIQKK